MYRMARTPLTTSNLKQQPFFPVENKSSTIYMYKTQNCLKITGGEEINLKVLSPSHFVENYFFRKTHWKYFEINRQRK